MSDLRTEAYRHNISGIEFDCGLCGEGWEQDLADVRLMDGAERVAEDVCPKCIDAGPGGAAERIAERSPGAEPADQGAFRRALGGGGAGGPWLHGAFAG